MQAELLNNKLISLGTYYGIAQKHGLCTALGIKALEDAKAQGCKYAISQLMASAMAGGIAKKAGFQTYCEFLPFLGGQAQ